MAMIETNFIRPQEVYDRNTGESKVRYRSYDGNDRFIPVVDGEKGVPKTMVEVTHAELKAMRDGGKLTAGALYRITDYNCTTTQENTQSAGHQFDIVLLALSEDKLAEEGWAMMHDNIYDVTFADGITKKCWLQMAGVDSGGNQMMNVVDTESRLGVTTALEEFTINENDKTAFTQDWTSTELNDENLPYNYFQNSNLSAWKVWYCLDNDKSRFAWAQEEVTNSVQFYNYGTLRTAVYQQKVTISNKTYFVWYSASPYPVYILTEQRVIKRGSDGRYPIAYNTTSSLDSVGSPVISGLSNPDTVPGGTGVIYRLIDEWNNDCPYDFKNIQFELLIDDGYYEPQSQETAWVYGLNIWRASENIHQDASVIGNTLADGSTIEGVFNNIIKSVTDSSFIEHVRYLIPKSIMLSVADAEDYYYGLNNNLILGGNMSVVADSNYIKLSDCYNVNVKNSNHIIAIQSLSNEITEESVQMYIGNKKVLTEE